MTPNNNEKLTENASEYESWFFRLYTSKQRRSTQVGPWAAVETFSQKYWHFRPFSGKKTEVRIPNIPKKIFLSTGWTALASKIKKIKWNLLVALSLQNNRQNLFFLIFQLNFFNGEITVNAFVKIVKTEFLQMPKTFFLGYFNRITLALWKITSNKLIEKTKNFKAIFLWTISKNEWCNGFEKLLSKRANCKIQWKLSAAYQIRFGFTEHEKKAIR
jgi:hypothetical protein